MSVWRLSTSFTYPHLLTYSLARFVSGLIRADPNPNPNPNPNQDLDELESEAYDVEQKLRTIERIYRTQPSLLKPGAVPGLPPYEPSP